MMELEEDILLEEGLLSFVETEGNESSQEEAKM